MRRSQTRAALSGCGGATTPGGPGEPGHLGDDILRIGDVQQQHALVRQVEGTGRRAGAGRVGLHDLGGQAVLGRELSGCQVLTAA
jgi:hypothetical protein